MTQKVAPTCSSCQCGIRLPCNQLEITSSFIARTVRLLLKFAQMTHGHTVDTVRHFFSSSCSSLANLHYYLAVALHMNVRESYEHRPAALCFVLIYMVYIQIFCYLSTERSTCQIVWTTINNQAIDVKHLVLNLYLYV